MQHETTESPTQQRDRDCDERNVIPDGGRVDTCQADLEDEPRKSDEKNCRMTGHGARKYHRRDAEAAEKALYVFFLCVSAVSFGYFVQSRCNVESSPMSKVRHRAN